MILSAYQRCTRKGTFSQISYLSKYAPKKSKIPLHIPGTNSERKALRDGVLALIIYACSYRCNVGLKILGECITNDMHGICEAAEST